MALTLEEREQRRKNRKKLRRKERKQAMSEEAWLLQRKLGGKPVEEWDAEELARGRPRASDGSFRGKKPDYVTRAIHEKAIQLFTEHTRKELRGVVPQALETIRWILGEEDVDRRGRPIVPASVKLDAAKWVVEHIVGKARQPVDMDISVKLTAILANVMVQPGDLGINGVDEARALMPAVSPEFTDMVDAEVLDDDEAVLSQS